MFGKAQAANGTGSGYKLVGAAARSPGVPLGWGVGLLGCVAAMAMML